MLAPDLKADYIMANPPFNLKDWRGPDTAMRESAILETEGKPQVVREAKDNRVHDGRWNGYDTPPTGNANYAWILHISSKSRPQKQLLVGGNRKIHFHSQTA